MYLAVATPVVVSQGVYTNNTVRLPRIEVMHHFGHMF